jgi:plasmid stabilization system protein ParE
MKAVFTAPASADLDEILEYTGQHYPQLVGPIERRIRAVVAHIRRWPESARKIDENPDIRFVPLMRYPYKIFYRIADDRIEILHIHHSSRQSWK